jgi:hypothetical protein
MDTGSLSALTTQEAMDPFQEQPAVEEVKEWDENELLNWTQKKRPKLLKGDRLGKFKAAEISGRVFLTLTGNVEFFKRECNLPAGPSRELADLAGEIAGGETSLASRGAKRKHDEVEIDWKSRLCKLINKGSPSSLAASPQFKTVAGLDKIIGCNRPFERDTIPIVLLHEAFGVFRDRCADLPSTKALLLLDKLTEACCGWYNLEPNRQVAVQEVLEEYASLKFTPQVVTLGDGKQCTTDGNLTVKIMPAAIRECKDFALNQAILYFSRFLYNALQNINSYNDHVFPSILLVDIGAFVSLDFPLNHWLMIYVESYLGFYGCVWDGMRIRADPLTPMFDLTAHSKDNMLRRDIASSLDAFLLAVNTIENFYLTMNTKACADSISDADQKRSPPRARGYPYVTSYEDAGIQISFFYNTRFDGTKLLFLATANQH